MQKYLHSAWRGRSRGNTHRCVLDNFDSGPHSRAERQIRRGNSCRWQHQRRQHQQHHILIPMPNPVARLSRSRFVALFISLLRELCVLVVVAVAVLLLLLQFLPLLSCRFPFGLLCVVLGFMRLLPPHRQTHTHTHTCTPVY